MKFGITRSSFFSKSRSEMKRVKESWMKPVSASELMMR